MMTETETPMITMAELWPMRIYPKAGAFWVELRDKTLGPFSTKQGAGGHLGELHEMAMGWRDPAIYVGSVIEKGESYFVDRWFTEDGPFASHELAQAHKEQLLSELVKEGDSGW